MATLTKGVISKNMRDDVLSNHANGYLLYKWVDDKLKVLNYSGSVIASERSIGFLNRIVIPPEHLYFTAAILDWIGLYQSQQHKHRLTTGLVRDLVSCSVKRTVCVAVLAMSIYSDVDRSHWFFD